MELRLEHVGHIYNPGTTYERRALDDVCMTIGNGEFIGLIGHTGSGKSTLVQHLNGLLLPSEGKIYADGEDISAEGYPLRKLRFRVGLVFQYPEYQLFEETVYRDIAFGPTNMKLSKAEIDVRVREAAAFTGVAEQRGYALILDRASDNGIVFASPTADISNEVLAKLGYSN